MLISILDVMSFDFDSDKFEVREGIQGVWHYHLSLKREKDTLCEKPSMNTKIKISEWGSQNPNHVPMSYCEECEEKAKSLDDLS